MEHPCCADDELSFLDSQEQSLIGSISKLVDGVDPLAYSRAIFLKKTLFL